MDSRCDDGKCEGNSGDKTENTISSTDIQGDTKNESNPSDLDSLGDRKDTEMKTELRKELGKSFLVLKPEQELDPFATEMLTENKIPKLLDVELSTFNGEDQLFYDISQKHSFYSRLERTKLTGQDLKSLLQQLHQMYTTLYMYFLEPQQVILEPQYIYEDEQGLYFCYDPSQREESREDQWLLFTENILSFVDHEEEAAVHLAYRFYKIVREENRTVQQALDLMMSEVSEYEQKEMKLEVTESVQEEALWESRTQEDIEWKQKTEEKQGPDIFTIAIFGVLFLSNILYFALRFWQQGYLHLAEEIGRREGLVALGLLILSVCGMAAGFFLRFDAKSSAAKIEHQD